MKMGEEEGSVWTLGLYVWRWGAVSDKRRQTAEAGLQRVGGADPAGFALNGFSSR